jgi:hypothetical protein
MAGSPRRRERRVVTWSYATIDTVLNHPDAPMVVKPPLKVRDGDVLAGQGLADVAGEVPFEAAQDVFGGQLF